MTYLGLESRIFHIHGQKLKRVLTIRMYWRRGSSTVVFPIGINFIAAEISYLHWKRILCCVKVERIWSECWDLFGELTESVTEWAFYYLSHTFVWWLNFIPGIQLTETSPFITAMTERSCDFSVFCYRRQTYCSSHTAFWFIACLLLA